MATTLYSDRLIVITDEQIVFKQYRFLIWGRKVVPLDNIEQIVVQKPTMTNGQWRIQGTGDFIWWFPQDWGRPSRDRIFFAYLKKGWFNIAFTAMNGEQVQSILQDMNLLEVP